MTNNKSGSLPEEYSYGIIPLSRKDGVWYMFLVRHRSGGHWGFPKGHSLEGESPKETALRELKEETGFRVKSFLSPTPFIEHYRLLRHGREVLKQVSYFLAEVDGELKLQNEELLEGNWFSLSDSLERLTFAEGKNIWHQVHDLIPK